MKCEICQKNVFEAQSLHRVNEFGVKGIWRCEKCLTVQQKDGIDDTVKEIIEIFKVKC